MKHLVLLLCLWVPSLAWAQDALKGYREAKQAILDEDFKAGMDGLRPYLDRSTYGQLSAYAHMHFALAAFRNEQYSLATSTLQALGQPPSGRESEWHYLQALLKFQQKDYIGGLTAVELIRDEQVYARAEEATFTYLQQAPLSSLVGNMRAFQRNKGFLAATSRLLQEKAVMSTEEAQALSQIQANAAGNVGGGPVKPTLNREQLDIALVLPFSFGEEKGKAALSGNNFLFELQQGMQLAVEEQRKRGRKLNMQSFDTERDPAKVLSILQEPYLRTADVMIGPLYPEETQLIGDFARQRALPFINPLSNLDDLVQDNPQAYLFRPAVGTIAAKIVEHLSGPLQAKRIALAYSPSSRDQQLAEAIKQQAARKGIRVTQEEEIRGNGMRNFLERLGIESREVQVDAILVLSDNPSIAQPTLAQVEAIDFETPIIVPDSWLFFPFANYEMKAESQFLFFGNNTIPQTGRKLRHFREQFFERYQAYPSVHAQLGYEMILWLSETLSPSKGLDLHQNLSKQGLFQNGISLGLDFQQGSRSNAFVPMVRLVRGELVIQ
ncbi:MAG: ABC transporter substrate-binding protein [Nitritalea sp.]